MPYSAPIISALTTSNSATEAREPDRKADDHAGDRAENPPRSDAHDRNRQMMPKRAALRELVDCDRDRRRRRQKQRIDPPGAAGHLPKPDRQRERQPARIAARARHKTRAAKFYRPRFGVGVRLRRGR